MQDSYTWFGNDVYSYVTDDWEIVGVFGVSDWDRNDQDRNDGMMSWEWSGVLRKTDWDSNDLIGMLRNTPMSAYRKQSDCATEESEDDNHDEESEDDNHSFLYLCRQVSS